ncbi:MAG: HNH endonuclease family protein [Deltaproteobacteria bacterium]|nr:HNH endonuclease family protein [Deltaproteobacteria bacterium]
MVLETLQAEEKEDLTVTFLRHALMVIRGFLRKDKVYEVVQETKGPQASIAFLKKVENLVKVYVATFYRDHDHWKSYPDAILPAIDTINFFDIAPFRPVILAIAAKFPPKEALNAFKIFISLGVRLLIATSTRSGSVEETLAPAANKIYIGRISTAAELKTEINGLIPNDTQFQQAFENATVSKGPLARYYLRALENAHQKRPDPYYILQSDKEEITLEHILPEKPEHNWPQFSLEEHASYWRRIGNMILLRYKDNSGLKSNPFQEKIPVYKSCPYRLTSQVSDVQDWTVEKIRERQVGLAKLALKAWPI